MRAIWVKIGLTAVLFLAAYAELARAHGSMFFGILFLLGGVLGLFVIRGADSQGRLSDND